MRQYFFYFFLFIPSTLCCFNKFFLFLPPSEVVPLIARDGYWYARVYGNCSEQSCLGGALYSCVHRNVGFWALFEGLNDEKSRGILALSYAHSYLEHEKFDFIDINMRIGCAAIENNKICLFAHAAQSFGMYYWLDVGWYGSLYCGNAHASMDQCIAGLYFKIDHIFQYVSFQINTEYAYKPTSNSLWDVCALVELDCSGYEMEAAPLVQWWYRWQMKDTCIKSGWDVSVGMNGCFYY